MYFNIKKFNKRKTEARSLDKQLHNWYYTGYFSLHIEIK